MWSFKYWSYFCWILNMAIQYDTAILLVIPIRNCRNCLPRETSTLTHMGILSLGAISHAREQRKILKVKII